MSFFQPVCKGPALYRSKQDIIVTLAPYHTISRSASVLWGTVTSGYFILCALKRDFVGDSGSTYSLDKCHLTSGCNKKTKFYGTTIFFVFSGGTALGSLGFETSPLFLHFTLKRGLLIALTLSVLVISVCELSETTAATVTKLIGKFSVFPFKPQVSLLIIANISLSVGDIISRLIYTPPLEIYPALQAEPSRITHHREKPLGYQYFLWISGRLVYHRLSCTLSILPGRLKLLRSRILMSLRDMHILEL